MHRGQVWLINLDPTVGAEIKKTRPAVVVNNDAIGILPLKVVVPITDWKDRYAIAPWRFVWNLMQRTDWTRFLQRMPFRCARWLRNGLFDNWESSPTQLCVIYQSIGHCAEH